MKNLTVTLSLFFLFFSIANIGFAKSKSKQKPLGVLYKVTGDVKYTKNGKKWRKVRRNKFLFIGYQIKTGDDGSGMITNQETGQNVALKPNSLIEITKDGIVAKSGQLDEVQKTSDLISGLLNRFTKSQSYTTVRRSASKPKGAEFETVRKLTISEDFPYFIWQNVNSKYNYKFIINDKTYAIPASEEKVIKVKLEPFNAEQKYDIMAFENDEEVLTLKKEQRGRKINYRILFLSKNENSKLNDDIDLIKNDYPDNAYMLGTLYARNNMWLAAIKQYRTFLQEYPDETEMALSLLEAYRRLKLNDIYQEQYKTWEDAMKTGKDYTLYPDSLF
jgi:hypothetical protein